MNYLVDFNAFLGRVGNMYGKKDICPPFESGGMRRRGGKTG
jgi:hypothetical protein